MLIGVGIDIFSLTRLQGVINRRGADALARRLCAPIELEAYKKLQGDERKLKFLSARYVPYLVLRYPNARLHRTSRATPFMRTREKS